MISHQVSFTKQIIGLWFLFGTGIMGPLSTSASTAGTTDVKQMDVEPVDIEPVAVVAIQPNAQLAMDRVIALSTTSPVKKGRLQLTIDHRAYKSFISGEDAFFDYLGLDTGSLKIGFDLRYGLSDIFDVGVARLSNGVDRFDVVQFDARAKFLTQELHLINMALKAGATWFVQKDAKDAAGFFAQLIADRQLIKKRLLIGAGLAFHSDSTGGHKSIRDEDPSAAVLGLLSWRMIEKFALEAEIGVNVAGYGERAPMFGFGARVFTHRHAFALVVSNSQYITADGVVAGSFRDFSNVVFGFQITRAFDLAEAH